jgi:hypothetical protein
LALDGLLEAVGIDISQYGLGDVVLQPRASDPDVPRLVAAVLAPLRPARVCAGCVLPRRPDRLGFGRSQSAASTGSSFLMHAATHR